jgi:hypothetical protein
MGIGKPPDIRANELGGFLLSFVAARLSSMVELAAKPNFLRFTPALPPW